MSQFETLEEEVVRLRAECYRLLVFNGELDRERRVALELRTQMGLALQNADEISLSLHKQVASVIAERDERFRQVGELGVQVGGLTLALASARQGCETAERRLSELLEAVEGGGDKGQ